MVYRFVNDYVLLLLLYTLDARKDHATAVPANEEFSTGNEPGSKSTAHHDRI
jgi:hypothetical protein